MKYIAIDIGSSFIKSSVLDIEKLDITHIMRQGTPHKLPCENPLAFEVDSLEIYHIVIQMIRQHIDAVGTVKGILFSTQMHGFILCDDKKTPVTPYVSWQDTRCLEQYKDGPLNYMEYLSELIDADDIEKTGLKLKSRLAVCNLFHWIEKNEDILKKNRKLNFCTLGSYIIYKLAGHNACHITNAAATGLVDLTTGEWNRNIINTAGCAGFAFPEILEEDKVCGYYTGAFGNIPVYTDIGDHQATVLGSMAKQEKDVIITAGTAGIASRITLDRAVGEYERRPYFDNYILRTATQLPGGRNLDVLINFIKEIGIHIFKVNIDAKSIWKEIFDVMVNDSTENVEVDLGFFKDQMGVTKGKIDRISDANLTVSSLFKGAFLNMAHIYTSAMERIMDLSGSMDKLILSGGVFADNIFLMEAIEKTSCKKVELSPTKEEALMGLLRIALKVSGRCSTLDETAQLLKEKNKQPWHMWDRIRDIK